MMRVQVSGERIDGNDADIALAASISFGKGYVDFNRVEPIIRGLIANQETVPFEFASIWFKVRCSRACHSQMLQYRHASRITRSLRRTKPLELEDRSLMTEETVPSFARYEALLKAGWKKEDAREVLPLATLTEFHILMNLRSLMHFLEERLSLHAQGEVREVAGKMRDIFKRKFPVSFNAWAESYFHRLEECGMASQDSGT